MMYKFTGYDIVYILKSLVILNIYDPDIWDELVDRFYLNGFTELKVMEKAVVFKLCVCLEMDRPDGYLG